MKQCVKLCLFLIFVISANSQDFTYVKSAEQSKFFFVMYEFGKGVCYKVDDKEGISQNWVTNGWWCYPEQIFLSNDGNILVRVHTVIVDAKIDGNAPVFDIIKSGEIAKRILLKDVVDLEKVVIFEKSFRRNAGFILKEGKMGIYGAGGVIQMIGLASSPSISAREAKGSYQFFYLKNTGGEHIVFDLDKCEIIYRDKDAKKTPETKLPWE